MSITYFKNLYDKKPIYTTVEKIIDGLKTGANQADLINQIRNTLDKEERDELKKQLAVVCFGGKFKERRASALLEYSRLIVLDFDECNVASKKTELMLLPYIYAIFLSPSGDGLKALVKVSSDNHIGHFRALEKEMTGLDGSGKDVSRACFMSLDPNLYLNSSPDIYTKIVESVYTNEQKLELLKKWLENKGDRFASGNRNNFLVKLAGAANRFGLEQSFVEGAFTKDYVSSDFLTREAESVVRGIYSRYSAEFGSQSFDEPTSEARTAEIMSAELPTNDAIYLNDVEQDLLNDYENGTPGAGTTYFPSIDSIFRPLRGDLNVLGGIGGFGKSSWKKQLDLVTAKKEGRKHVFFGPEDFPPMYWFKELVRSYVGKPLEREERNRMTLVEYKRAMEFVREHFIYVYPPTLPTPEYILDRFAEVIIKHGVSSVTIDPFNQLNHIMVKRDDIYLRETLSKFERFAQQQNCFLTVIAHPNRVQKKADGNYETPDSMDLNGGPSWNNGATNICFYHRPYYSTDKSDPTVQIHSKKIKRQMVSGFPGMAELTYDRKVGRYYDTGYSPLDD